MATRKLLLAERKLQLAIRILALADSILVMAKTGKQPANQPFSPSISHAHTLTFPAKAGQVMVNQSLVLRMNICGKNRHLLVAPNRYASL